jgi:hypothetical protein
MSAFQNVTSLTDAFVATNTVSGGTFAYGIPIIVWIAIFGFAMPNGRSQAITAASFVTGIMLLLMNMVGLVQYWVIILDLVVLSVGIVGIFLERRGN